MKAPKSVLGTCCALMFACSVAANAQTSISYEIGSRTTMTTTELNFTDDLLLFDSSLGTLTAATLTLYQAVETTVGTTNHSAQTQQFRVTGFSYLYWSSDNADIDALIKGPEGVGTSFSVSTGPSTLQVLGAGESAVVGPLFGNDERSIDLGDYLDDFQADGGGTFSLAASTLSGLMISGGGGNIDSSQSTYAGVHAMITYTYTPVPEPTGAVLAGASALMFCLRRQRRAAI